ncbi:MAG: DEAD/DEAH box helicase family protein [Thermoflexales bacterium]|nr:DEAD/DEAH box helicase family protein [Thermoflexales bacterium]
MPQETDARIVIDRLLREAGWDIEDKAQVSTEEAVTAGRADYVLKDSRARPLVVIEAKRFSVDPYAAKDQAREYARTLPVHFVILSNGDDHYLWDYADGDARPILGMPAQADLERRANLKLHRKGQLSQSLAAVPYPQRFRFKGEEVTVRPYQLECLHAADAAMAAGRRRMLLEMATGAGKTLTIAMLLKRWFQAGLISRVLFLADRIELARQAKQDTFDDYLAQWPSTLLYGGRRSLEGQIVVGTLDTIAGQLGSGGFGHAYFDAVVTDECHRSIYGAHRAMLEHFDAIHIGITATPNPGELRWVSETERQLVRSTYLFFGCWDSAQQIGKPTFCYDIQRGIADGYLARYQIYLAESRLTFEGAQWEGDDIAPGEWERTYTSLDRNKLMVDEFYRVEAERPSEHPRKTLVFAIGERHAAQLEQLFNQAVSDDEVLRIAQHYNLSPGEVRANYAKKITSYSNNGFPRPLIDRFKYDVLPVIGISVDMLDTGYDHKDLENLVMMRPTRSAIKYAQMRGRGNRCCERNPRGEIINKSSFVIYDFAGNTEQFNDPGEQYQRPRLVGKRLAESRPAGSEGFQVVEGQEPAAKLRPRELVTIPLGSLQDEFRRRETLIVGPEGLAIDRRSYLNEWQAVIGRMKDADLAIRAIAEGGEVSEAELERLAARLNSPEFWFTEKSLREAYGQPVGSLFDFVRVALGRQRFPTREERIESSLQAWVASRSLNPDQAKMLRLLRNRFLAGETIDITLFNRDSTFGQIGGRRKMEQLFGEAGLRTILEELNARVFV